MITDKDESCLKTSTWHPEFEETEVYIERVVAYWSCLLKSTEKNYSPTEKEALTLKDSLVKFQPLIKGETITAITDHRALTWSKTYHNVNHRLMSWGLTFPAYPNLKIVHWAGRVHSNVDPLSRLEWRIPFFDQPASNDPDVNLSQEKDIDFYGRMKRKFDTQASSLFALIEEPLTTWINVKLPADHPLETLSHHTATRIKTLLHIDSTEIQSFQDGYMEDPYFKNIMGSFPKEAPFIYKSYQQSPDNLIFFHDSSGCRQLCVPSSLRRGIMKEIHESMTGAAHSGFKQMYSWITNGYFGLEWPEIFVHSSRPVLYVKRSSMLNTYLMVSYNLSPSWHNLLK